MPAVSVARVADLVQRLASQPIAESDASLLARFVKTRDEEAFAGLVERHGPLVRGVARRVLGDISAVDDIVQATFIVLARKAGTIRRRQSLSAWLHGTSRRLALKHQVQESGRRGRERRAAKPEALNAEQAWHELHAILDEEIQKLPESLRGPLFLCYFDGRTQDEAARQTGLSVPTLRRRLDKGRALLRLRLERRGIAPALALTSLALARRTITAAAARQITAHALAASVNAEFGAAFADTMRGTSRNLGRAIAGIVLVSSIFVSGAGQSEPPANPTPTGSPAVTRREPRVDAEGVPLPEGALARVGSTRLRHGGFLTSIAFSPDGATLATAGLPGGLALWDTAAGKLKRRLNLLGVVHTPTALRFLADGTLVVVDGNACYRIAPDAKTTINMHTPVGWKFGDGVTAADISPDGSRFAIGRSDKTVHVHDAADSTLLWKEQLTGGIIRTLGFSPDGKTLAVAASLSVTWLREASTGKPIAELEGAQKAVWALAFSRDGKSLATLDVVDDRTLVIWDVATQKPRVQVAGFDYAPMSVAFSPDGNYLVASGGDSKVKLIDAKEGKIVRSFGNWSSQSRYAFSPDGKIIACGSSVGFISLWDGKTGEMVRAADPFGGVYTMRFSGDGKNLAYLADVFCMRQWHGGGVESRLDGVDADSYYSDITPDCTSAAIPRPYLEGGVRVYDTNTGKERFTHATPKTFVRKSRFSSDGRRLFVGRNDGLIDVIDAADGNLLRSFEVKRGTMVGPFAASPDGRWLAAVPNPGNALNDFSIRVWDLKSGAEVRRFTPSGEPILGLVFSPDSSFLAVVGGDFGPPSPPGLVEIWERETGKLVAAFAGHQKRVLTVAFSPDGRTLATGDFDHCIRLWEVRSGIERRRIEGHQNPITSLAFSPDGLNLASASNDAPMYVWDVYAPPGHTPARSANELWDDLNSASAHLGAIGDMIAKPDMAIALCRARIKPVDKPDEKKVLRLIEQLNDADYRVRDKAESELRKLGDVVEPILKHELTVNTSAETISRLKRLLSDFATPTGERAAALRAIEALEHINSTQARAVMQEWAGGCPDSSFTRAAKKALEHMDAR